MAIPLLKVTRYFSYSDEKISKTYKSKYAMSKVKRLLSANWKRIMKKIYWKHAKTVLSKVKEYKLINPKDVEVMVKTSWKINGELKVFDSLNETLNRSVKLLVTSPPYLQSQEYIRSFKIELSWLGFTGSDLRILSKFEIPYNKPSSKTEIHSATYKEYRKRIAAFQHPRLINIYDNYFKSLTQFLNNNADKVEFIAFFVGPAKIRTIRIPIDEILKEHLEYLGFEHVETIIDKIVSRRLFKSNTNPATGIADERMPTEHLLVMRNAQR